MMDFRNARMPAVAPSSGDNAEHRDRQSYRRTGRSYAGQRQFIRRGAAIVDRRHLHGFSASARRATCTACTFSLATRCVFDASEAGERLRAGALTSWRNMACLTFGDRSRVRVMTDADWRIIWRGRSHGRGTPIVWQQVRPESEC